MKALTYTLILALASISTLSSNAQQVVNKPLQSLSGHKGIVDAIVYSPNGKFIASTGWDKTIKVWDAESGALVHDFVAHDGAVNCLAYSRDNKMLISGARDNSVRIWDTAMNMKYSLYGHQNTINAVLIDPSLRYAYSGGDDMMLKVWDLKKKGESRTLKKMPRKINDIVVSIRGRDIYVATEGPDIYNLTVVGKEKLIFSGHTDEVNDIEYAFNNRYLISGSSDKTAIIWDVKNGKALQTLKGHTWKVTQVAFSVDSRFAITGSTDGTVKLWDVETGKELYSFENGVNAISALAMSPDITRIASAAMVNSYEPEEKKNLIYIWDSHQELVAVTKARLQKERLDSMQRAKDSAKRAQDSARRAVDSLKRVEKQRKIEERRKQLEQKNKGKGTPQKGSRINAILTEETFI